jgi:hypothetical protein
VPPDGRLSAAAAHHRTSRRRLQTLFAGRAGVALVFYADPRLWFGRLTNLAESRYGEHAHQGAPSAKD